MPSKSVIDHQQVMAWWEKAKNHLHDQEDGPLNKINELEALLKRREQHPANFLTSHLDGLAVSDALKDELADMLLESAREIHDGYIHDLYRGIIINTGNLHHQIPPDKYPVSESLVQVFDTLSNAPFHFVENGFNAHRESISTPYNVRVIGGSTVVFSHPNPLPCILWMLEHNTEDFS